VINYLATHYPRVANYDDNSRLPRTVLQGKATKYRVVQYDLKNRHAETHDIAVDPQGNGWVNQRSGGKLGRLDGKTLEYREVSLPPGEADQPRPGNPQVDLKTGLLWVPDSSTDRRWLSMDTRTEKFKSYPFPKSIRGGANGNTMAVHPNGTIWSSGPGSARVLNPATGEFKAYDTPTWLKTKRNPIGYGITVAGDGQVWFAQSDVDIMAKVDPATGKVDEFKISLGPTAYPRRMDTDAEGNVWVGLWSGGKLMKIESKTGKMTFYTPPSKDSGPYSVSVDHKSGLIWVSLQQVDKIASFNPKTQEWVEYPLPESESDVRRIEVDPTNPNRIWWTGTILSRMGFLEVLGN
jgi:streptogramin lyase